MVFKQIFPALKKISCAGLLLFVAVGCDKMNPNPAVLASTNVTISFGTDPAQVVLGESATLSWSVNDPDGVAKTVSISGGGVSKVVSLSDSMSVTPEASSVYYINVLNAENDVVKSGQTSIKVVDANGTEIGEAGEVVSETVCDDGEDDEGDGAVDCLDSDCADDTVACPIAEEPTAPAGGSFSTEPSFTFEGDSLCVGDTATVTWASDFDSIVITILIDGAAIDNDFVYGDSALNGNYPIEITSDAGVVLEFVGSKGSVTAETFSLPIATSGEAACAAPTFQGKLSVSVYPAKKLIEGEAYALSWESQNLSSIKLDGDNVAENVSFEDAEVRTASGDSIEHVFDLVDDQEEPMSEPRTVKLTVAGFDLAAQGDLAGGVDKIVSADKTSEAYILSGQKVFQATKNLTSFASVLDASTLAVTADAYLEHPATGLKQSKLVGYAKTDSKSYLATEDYFYEVSGSTAKVIENLTLVSADWQYNFIYTSGDLVTVGTNYGLYRWDPNGDCSEGEKISGYCCNLIGIDGDAIGTCSDSEESANYRGFFKKDADTLFLITSTGVYKSTNGGKTFNTASIIDGSITNIQGGVWSSHGPYLWSDNQVYEYNDSNFRIVDGLTTDMTGGRIDFAKSHGGRLFVATQNGLYIKNVVGWSAEPVLAGQISYMGFSAKVAKGLKVKRDGSGKFNVEVVEGDGQSTSYTATVLTSEGKTSSLPYGRDLNLQIR